MSKRIVIRNVKIDDVRPESVVGRDVLGLQNQVILKKGVKLTSNLVAQIKRMGIGTIFIEAEEEVAELDPKALEEEMCKIDSLIERKFRRASTDNRVMMGLKDIFREFLKGKISNGS